MRKGAVQICEESAVDFVPHDLRRTAASHMMSMGISRLVVSKILNHVESHITAVYDRHSYDAEKREALDAWGDRLDEILSWSDPRAMSTRNRSEGEPHWTDDWSCMGQVGRDPDGTIRAAAVANDEANFGYVFDPALAKAFVERRGNHGELSNDFFSEEELSKAVTGAMRRSAYRRIREQVTEG